MTLLQQDNLNTILITIYAFVDDFVKTLLSNIQPELMSPTRGVPPTKKHNLSIAELVSLGIFRFFIGHRNWKDFYRHITTYHAKDFPALPTYQNFIASLNKLSAFAAIMLHGFMHVFKQFTPQLSPKFADATKLEVCRIKREFTHKVVKEYASKSKSTMGWFYGFKLHIICNELMQILGLKITTATLDDRKGLAMIWNDIFGMIVADAGYVGANWMTKAKNLGKHLFTCVRANMKKLMTSIQHQLVKMRQCVETVFSVLKLRFGLETSLPRSPLGYFAHYVWCLTAYQFKKFMEFVSVKRLVA